MVTGFIIDSMHTLDLGVILHFLEDVLFGFNPEKKKEGRSGPKIPFLSPAAFGILNERVMKELKPTFAKGTARTLR